MYIPNPLFGDLHPPLSALALPPDTVSRPVSMILSFLGNSPVVSISYTQISSPPKYVSSTRLLNSSISNSSIVLFILYHPSYHLYPVYPYFDKYVSIYCILPQITAFNTEKKTSDLLILLSNRRRPIFPGSHPPSIVGAKELNCCVRDGNRCSLLAIATRSSE